MRSSENDKVEVVLDTNTVISAVLAEESKPSEVFEIVLSDKVMSYTLVSIIEEVEDVLHRPKIQKYISEEQAATFLNLYKHTSTTIQTSLSFDAVEDPDDNKFLECAVESSADYIVTGDSHLLELEEFKGVKIVKARKFLERFRKHNHSGYITGEHQGF